LNQFLNSSTPEEAANTTVINDLVSLNGDLAEIILDRIEDAIIDSAERDRKQNEEDEDDKQDDTWPNWDEPAFEPLPPPEQIDP